MAALDTTLAQRQALLAAHGLDAWPTIMDPAQAAALQQYAHVAVEAIYQQGHFETSNFEGLMLEIDAHAAGLRDGVRYRVEGLLTPGMGPDERCVGYNGPHLRPFALEAVSAGRTAHRAGLTIHAHRSPGELRSDGRGGFLEPRQSRDDVLTGQLGDTVYIACIRVMSRASEASSILYPCRTAWQGMFPDGGSSLFWIVGGREDAPAPVVELPRDPAAGVLAVREHLLARIHRTPNGCGVDGVIMAFASGAVHCLRMGQHRVLRRVGARVDTVLWEHTMHREAPVPAADLPEWTRRRTLSALTPGPPPGPVHATTAGLGQRWIVVSGGLLPSLVDDPGDDEVARALAADRPDALATWLAAAAARRPDAHELPAWGLVVVDLGAPRPPPPAPKPLDLGSLLGQLHALEKERTS